MKRILNLVMVGVLSMFFLNYSAHADEQEHGKMLGEVKDSISICPVTGKPASKDFSYTYEGKTYYFCCSKCIDKFKENPQKYISKIKEIEVTSFRYGYSPEVIEVNKGDIVKLSATSSDVPHGLYIKEYDINIKVEKGKVKKVEFIADKKGEFDIICSVYCGPGHSKMKSKLIVK